MIKKRESRNRKIAYMFVTIVVIFYLVWIPLYVVSYSKNPHKRTGVLEVQADFVLIHWVFSAKST